MRKLFHPDAEQVFDRGLARLYDTVAQVMDRAERKSKRVAVRRKKPNARAAGAGVGVTSVPSSTEQGELVSSSA